MKKITKILILVTIFCTASSCSKDEDKAVIDCFGESLLIQLKHTSDATNPKIINYSIQNDNDSAVTSVKWTFGDGKTETINTASGAVSHTYTAAGTFEVKADVILSTGCTVSPKKNITVN